MAKKRKAVTTTVIELFLVAVQGFVQVVRRSCMPENGLLPDGSDSSVRAVIRWPPSDHPALVSGVASPLQQQLPSRHRRCRNACGPCPYSCLTALPQCPVTPPTQKAPSSGSFITCLEIQAVRVVRSLRRLDWIKVGLTAFFIQRAGGDSACRTETGDGVRLVLCLVTVVPRAGQRFMSLHRLHRGDLWKGSCLLLPSVDR